MRQLVVLFTYLLSPILYGETLRIGTSDDSLIYEMEQKIYKELSRRIDNLTIEIVKLPLKRSLVMAQQGLLDGDAARVKDFKSRADMDLTNLISLNESIVTAEFRVIHRPDTRAVQSLDELKANRITFLRGIILLEKMFEKSEVHLVDQESLAIPLIRKRRFDYHIASSLNGQLLLEPKEYENLILGPQLFSVDLYPVIHKSKLGWGRKIEKVLKQMRDDGTLGRLTESAIAQN